MDRVVLDTDIFSEVLRRRNEAVVRNATAYLQARGRFTITVVTVLEVVSGWHRLGREDRIEELMRLIASMDVLHLDIAGAERAGRIEADLARSGVPIGRADSMIAAMAMCHGLPLVTGNAEHYGRIRRLGHALEVRDWR